MYLAPSGVQKERILPEHIFVLPFAQSSIPKSGSQRDFVRIPTKKVGILIVGKGKCLYQGLKESACTPLFWNAFTQRNAGACIHTHSQHAGKSLLPPLSALLYGPTGPSLPWTGDLADLSVLLTLLLPRDAEVFRISHQEMIKGVRLGGNGSTLKFYDTLEVPIIENTADEEDLTDGMAAAMQKYPNAAAILVRRHGVYVWGQLRLSQVQGEVGRVLMSRKRLGIGKDSVGVPGLSVRDGYKNVAKQSAARRGQVSG